MKHPIVWVAPGEENGAYRCLIEEAVEETTEPYPPPPLRELLFTFTEAEPSIVTVMSTARHHPMLPAESKLRATDELSDLLWGTEQFYVVSELGDTISNYTDDFASLLAFARKSPRVQPGSKIQRLSDGTVLAYRAAIKPTKDYFVTEAKTPK